MRGTRLAILSVILLSNLGVAAFFVPEPCATLETGAQPDDACPVTCVRCTCCAQPVMASELMVPGCLARLGDDWRAPSPQLPATAPREVLHVPKVRQ